MKQAERIKMVKSMEFIARNLNDEEIFEAWLIDGVADGDIAYGDLTGEMDEWNAMEWYIEDEHFAELMDLFLRMMKCAVKSGGLYCDDIVSK